MFQANYIYLLEVPEKHKQSQIQDRYWTLVLDLHLVKVKQHVGGIAGRSRLGNDTFDVELRIRGSQYFGYESKEQMGPRVKNMS